MTVLVKAIESIIDIQLRQSTDPDSAPEDPSGSSPYDGWSGHIKSLMTGLLSVDTTVSGSYTARKALQKLMHEHGDILSECWQP